MVWDGTLVEQFDQGGARHIQQVGRFLSGQLGMDGHQAHAIAFTQLGQQIDKQTQGADRDVDRADPPSGITDG
ncbi:hypothetical protein D3C78_1097230 [compost metagenome]